MIKYDFAGKIIVVTGALGQLGRAFVSKLIESNAKVVGIDILDEDRANEITQAENFLYFKGNITSKERLEEIKVKVEKDWGKITGLINNAAIDFPPNSESASCSFENMNIPLLKEVLDVNILGSVIPAMVFGGEMANTGNGSIINIGSIYGMLSPDQGIYDYKRVDGKEWYKPSSYAISKSSIYNLTRYLSVYWGSKKVRVNTISPAGIFNHQEEAFLKNYLPKVPLGRMAEPEDICNAAMFLLSDHAGYITGHNLVVDGGYTAM